MLIYFAKVDYHQGLPFHSPAHKQPHLPHRFDNNQHLRHYYDHVKCFVQLNHDETKDGCRQLLKRFIHRDHRRLVQLVTKYFYKGVQGRKDERVRSFWKEWDVIIRRINVPVIIDTPVDQRPVRLIAHFAQRLEVECRHGLSDVSFFHGSMTHLQRVLVQWPSTRHLDLLLSVLGTQPVVMKHIRESPWLRRSFQLKFSTGLVHQDGLLIPQFTVLPDVNVLDFMRQLTEQLVESTLLIQEDLKKVHDTNIVPITKLFHSNIFNYYNDLSTHEISIIHRGESVQYPKFFHSSSSSSPPPPSPKPQKPTAFHSLEQCQSYYDTLKQYAQLSHNGSLFGFRDLLLYYTHTDQDTSLKILISSYGAGHQTGQDGVRCRGCFHCSWDTFWEEWESVLYFQVRRYPSQQKLLKVIDGAVGKFEAKLGMLKRLGIPVKLIREELGTMQRALGKYPNLKLLEKLVGVIDKEFGIRSVLINIDGVVVTNDKSVALKKSVCVVEFMKHLIHAVEEWTVIQSEQDLIKSQHCEFHTPHGLVLRDKDHQAHELKTKVCDFCGEHSHSMESCSTFATFIRKGLLRYNKRGELCMDAGTLIGMNAKPPFLHTLRLGKYL